MQFTSSSLLLLASTAAAAATGSSSSSSKPACDQAVTALATGIHLNIVGQHAEYNGTQAILALETTEPFDYLGFLLLKGKLESDIQAGLNIRQFNQEIVPAGNPVVPGLAKYAAAQQVEKALAGNLTGFYPVDRAALESLKSNITTGIKLNEHNLATAISGCTLSITFPNANQSGS